MSGLTTKEAKRRLATYGENRLARENGLHPVRLFFTQFKDYMVLILLVASGISVLLGELADGVTMCLIVLLNAILGFVQEFRTEKTLESLRNLTAPTAFVCRDGTWQTISATELVPGDLLRLEAGDSVPADCTMVSTDPLTVNESVLTGESEPVEKCRGTALAEENSLHQSDVLYAGTGVLRGRAEVQVLATGLQTQMGQISALLESASPEQTPLQKRLGQLGKWVTALCLVVCVLVFLAGVLRGAPIFEMLMTGITIAIAAIPEGLPATVTIALALAVRRMMKLGALVNRLHSVETLGCTGVICSDKTGTITENRMTVTELYSAGERYPFEQMISTTLLSQKHCRELLTCGILCSTAEHTGQGDPTEVALLVAGEKAGLSVKTLREHFPLLHTDPFDSETKQMAVTVRCGKTTCIYRKGAWDVLLPGCTLQNCHGEFLPLSPGDKTALQKVAQEMSERGLRVLGFSKETDRGNVFLGFAGMLDPPRKAAVSAIRSCRRAGIRTVMITGDHPGTAVAIAKQAGIRRGNAVMTGAQLDLLTDAQLDRCLPEYGVFARVCPAHKLRLVQAYQRRGEIVAMTGDGVNDAPAIRAADVGVAMGKTGTDVARQAADVVLTDDNFATLTEAVKQGRAVYSNIRKFVRYLLSCNIGEVLTMFLGILLGMPSVLLPTQLLLVNLVTDGLPAVALGLEPPEGTVMHRPPRTPGESFFSDGLLLRILFRGIFIGLGTLMAFTILLRLGNPLQTARTAALCTLILSQLFYVFVCRTETRRGFPVLFGKNPWLLLSVLGSVLVLIGCVYHPALQSVFHTTALSGNALWISIGISLVVSLPVENGFRKGGDKN